MADYQFPEIIDSSMLNTWKACRQRWAFQYSAGLSSPKTSVHLHFGGCFASAIETARRAFYIDGRPSSECVAAAMNTALREWGDFVVDNPRITKTKETLLLAIEGYFREWPLGNDGLTPIFEGSSIEFSFSFPTPIMRPELARANEPILYGGRFDMIAKWEGMNAVVDEKTTGRSFSSDWAAGWPLRGQFLGYVCGVNAHGIDCHQIVVRGVSVLKTKISFVQLPVLVSQHIIDRWYSDTMAEIEDMVSAWKIRYFRRNLGDACSSYQMCQYSIMCQSKKPEDWESSYSISRWNPLSRGAASDD